MLSEVVGFAAALSICEHIRMKLLLPVLLAPQTSKLMGVVMGRMSSLGLNINRGGAAAAAAAATAAAESAASGGPRCSVEPDEEVSKVFMVLESTAVAAPAAEGVEHTVRSYSSTTSAIATLFFLCVYCASEALGQLLMDTSKQVPPALSVDDELRQERGLLGPDSSSKSLMLQLVPAATTPEQHSIFFC
jgi:hypothetical protein